jgi:hypothetical protein
MRGRDIVLVGVLLLVTAVAVVDALRGGGEPRVPNPVATALPRTTPVPRPVPRAPTDYPVGVLRGELIFAQRGDCRLRVFLLAGGFERILPSLTGCRFWVSPRGLAIAYAFHGRAIFRDLAFAPGADLGGFSNLSGPVIWSLDGRRAAWCTASGTGLDFDVREHELAPQALEHCPAAYTPDRKSAFVRGNRVVVGNETILRAAGEISFVSWGVDGSIGLLEGPRETLERWEGNRLVDVVEIPDRFARWPPVFSPDNCAALLRDVDGARFEVFALGCLEAERPDLLIFGGTAAAWSPDGRWIAVAYRDRIGFHRVADGEEIASWPARAAALAWTAD